jgi:1-acyl-sn-glycerol-3-phosphate acyltransferase
MITGAKALTGAQAEWQGCRPDNRQRIYVANHTSHLDFLLLWSALPPALRAHTRPVAAADYWERGAIRRFLALRVFNAVLVNRNGGPRDPTTRDPMLAALEHGDSLILFPEGTRGTGEALQPFKAGVFHLAKAHHDVEIVPVWMDNPSRVMPKGSLFLVPMLCSATFGAPVEIGPDEPKEQFLSRLRQSVSELGGS